MECFCAVVDALVLLVTGHNCMTQSSALNYTGEDIERRRRTMEANRRARSYGNYQRTSSGTVPLSSCRRRYFSNSQFATRRKKIVNVRRKITGKQLSRFSRHRR